MTNKLIKWHKHSSRIVFCSGWLSPAFTDVLTWSDGTCWRRQHRWMNDPLTAVIKERWHNWVSLYLFLSLVVFLFPSVPSCAALPFLQSSVCVCGLSGCLLPPCFGIAIDFLLLPAWASLLFLVATPALPRPSLHSTIPLSKFAPSSYPAIHPSIHPSIPSFKTARPQPVSFINHQQWGGTREQSAEREETEKGGRNSKCRKMEVTGQKRNLT